MWWCSLAPSSPCATAVALAALAVAAVLAVPLDHLVQGRAARATAGQDVAGERLRLHDVDIRVGEDGDQLVGRVAANQPARVEPLVRDLLEDGELVGISEVWGLAKPDPRFFARIAAELELNAAEIAYVGDRVDNDVMPAVAAGMVAVLIRRGPWGIVQAGWPEAMHARIRADSLEHAADRLVALA